ncbi:MAG: helix-turn-helix transcriptional regulator [Verrucomicrobiota bacterium]|jgi:DNA-binding PadR family transcriptional regulator
MYSPPVIPKDLVAASARPLVMSILAEGDSYGYAILQRVRELSKEEVEWADGMLYPVLHRLEREGLIASNWRESAAGRKRKYYHLNETGRAALATERRQWLTVHNTMARIWGLKPVSI